jgi:hypothetical protein
MTKTKASGAKPTKSESRPILDRAVANLEREIVQSAAPAGTTGPGDSPLLVAMAHTMVVYVRWRMVRGEGA